MLARLTHACATAAIGIGVLLAQTATAQAQSDPVEQFYKGRQVRVIITGAVSTDYDMYARLRKSVV